MAEGEIGFTTDTRRWYFGDGVTMGGVPAVAYRYETTLGSVSSGTIQQATHKITKPASVRVYAPSGDEVEILTRILPNGDVYFETFLTLTNYIIKIF